MKIARIKLKNDLVQYEEITSGSKYFLLGGRGLGSQILLDEVPPTCDPISDKNKLIISNGILAGSFFPCSARTSVCGKSPLTNGIKEANVGGRPGMMLALHGIRALILEDISPELKIILINDNGIELEKAEEYKGLGNYELHSKLRAKYGEQIGIYSIGPAGENLLKSSTVAANDLEGHPSRHAGRGGLGAVMGSKKIKAVVIFPTKSSKVKIHDLKEFREIVKPFVKWLSESKETFSIFGTPLMMKIMNEIGGIPTKNFRMGQFKDIDLISGQELHELTVARGGKKRLPCSPTCVIKCSNLFVDENGQHVTSSLEYETMVLNGTNCMINSIDSLAKIDHACDDAGIDTIEFGGTVAVAMDNGKIEWGDAERVLEIFEEIKANSDIGKLYGNGLLHIGRELNAKRIPQVKGQGISAYDPRIMKGMSVTFATSPMGADHTAGAAISGRSANKEKDFGELTENEGKLDLSYELQLYTTILDSMGCCYFIGPDYQNMEIITKAMNAMHGTSLKINDVINIGKKILKNEIEFNEKAGIGQDTNDLPEFFREEPLEPSGFKVTFPKEELRDLWKKLD